MAGGWQRKQWCKDDRCFLTRFPAYLWARRELLGRILTHVPVGVMTPMGGTITSHTEISIPYFKVYMEWAGIMDPQKQRHLFEELQEMHGDLERFKEGNGVFLQPEHTEEVIQIDPLTNDG